MVASGSRKNAMLMWRCIGVSRSETVLILGYLDTTARTNTKEKTPAMREDSHSGAFMTESARPSRAG
jgi:hypothetical protein